DDEVALLGRGAAEGALVGELLEEALDLRPGALPGGRSVVLEQYPARTALDAGGDEQRQAPCREVTPVGGAVAAGGERARGKARAPPAAHRDEGVDARLREAGALTVGDRHRGPQSRAQNRLLALGGRPGRPGAGRGGGAAGPARANAGQAAPERALIPPAAPQEPNTSTRPRRRSKACTRG